MEQKNKLPHILLITTDQQRGDCTGIDGHSILEDAAPRSACERGGLFPKGLHSLPGVHSGAGRTDDWAVSISNGVFLEYHQDNDFHGDAGTNSGPAGLPNAAGRQGALFPAPGADGIRQYDYQ